MGPGVTPHQGARGRPAHCLLTSCHLVDRFKLCRVLGQAWRHRGEQTLASWCPYREGDMLVRVSAVMGPNSTVA